MRSMRSTRPLLACLAVAGGLALAAGAYATVAVYSQSFNGKASVRAMKQASGGNRCAKGFRDKAKMMRVVVKRKDVLCSYSPPVIGDSAVPDHEISLMGRILKKETPRAVRRASYISLRLRVAKGSSYELQVFPHRERWRLERHPSGGDFPVVGTSQNIKGIGGKNRLRLRAFGAKVVAHVNGKRLVLITDPDPGQVKGRKIAFGVGSRKDTKRGPAAVFDNLRIAIPNP